MYIIKIEIGKIKKRIITKNLLTLEKITNTFLKYKDIFYIELIDNKGNILGNIQKYKDLILSPKGWFYEWYNVKENKIIIK